MKYTLQEIAKICGVSAGTVDRAVNNRPGIKQQTKDKILKVIEEVNYKPNKIAQSLAMGRTKTIGIVCFDLKNNYFAELVNAIEGIAKANGYFIDLILTHGDPQMEREGIDYLDERHVDGIILFSVCEIAKHTEYLKKLQIPIVTVYNKISDDFSFVGIDAKDAMENAVKFIVSKGYRRIIFLNAMITEKKMRHMNVYTLEERQQGYIEGLKKCNLHKPIILEGIHEERLIALIKECSPEKTAVLCINDMFAVEVLEICKKHQLRVPESVGIMGYDNIDMLRYISPKLCSVEYDVNILGECLFNELFVQIIEHKQPQNRILEYKIAFGESI